ncbi:hypothetical protein Tco_0808236 [Tanacetum coccineum]
MPLKIKDSYEQDSAAEEKIQQLTNGLQSYSSVGKSGRWHGRGTVIKRFIKDGDIYSRVEERHKSLVSILSLVREYNSQLTLDGRWRHVLGCGVTARHGEGNEEAAEDSFLCGWAQDRMKVYANRKRCEREFEVVDGLLTIKPEAILDRRMAKLNNKVAVYVLVKWANHSDENAT